MIETKEEMRGMNGDIPTLFFKNSAGEWVDALDWIRFAKLSRPQVHEKGELRTVSIRAGGLNTDSIVYGLSADGVVIPTPDGPWTRLFHNGVDATDEFMAVITGEVATDDTTALMSRIQKNSKAGRHSEAAFDMLWLAYVVAGRDTVERLKEITVRKGKEWHWPGS
ncbi:hypothetical protein AAC691_10325 [Nguyenibacter vanlangensis]|uniref:Uncharacterized protein n=1 Tax=Nguyenibacter vanlangensis TaxID=1216886 RepID=A0ABZ3DAG7_9PROT